MNHQRILEGHYTQLCASAQMVEAAIDAGAGFPDDADGWIEANILALRRLTEKMEAAIGRLDREAA